MIYLFHILFTYYNMKNYSSIGIVLVLLCTVPTSGFALGFTQTEPNNGFLDQEKPDWIEAKTIPTELYPTLAEAINAANLIKHETSRLQIASPTYEQAHRLLLQNLLMMQRQLHFNPADLLRFQSTSHPARSTVDPRIYEPNPSGLAMLPPMVVRTGTIKTNSLKNYYVNKRSRRTIVAMSEARNLARVNAR